MQIETYENDIKSALKYREDKNNLRKKIKIKHKIGEVTAVRCSKEDGRGSVY